MTNDRILEIAVEAGLWYSDSTDSDAKMLIAFARAIAAESARQTASVVDADDEGSNCNVCGSPVMYGERHHRCGSAVMEAEKSARQSGINEGLRMAAEKIAAHPLGSECDDWQDGFDSAIDEAAEEIRDLIKE